MFARRATLARREIKTLPWSRPSDSRRYRVWRRLVTHCCLHSLRVRPIAGRRCVDHSPPAPPVRRVTNYTTRRENRRTYGPVLPCTAELARRLVS